MSPVCSRWPAQNRGLTLESRRLINQIREWYLKMLLWNIACSVCKRRTLDWQCLPPLEWWRCCALWENPHCSAGLVMRFTRHTPCKIYACCWNLYSYCSGMWCWIQGLHADIKIGLQEYFSLLMTDIRAFSVWTCSGWGRGGGKKMHLPLDNIFILSYFMVFPLQPTWAACVVGRDQCRWYFWLQSFLWLAHI